MRHLICSAGLLFSLCLAAYIPRPQGYTITGTVTGLTDSTWLYLRTAQPEITLDSCRVLSGKFQMQGNLPQKALPVYLYTKGYTNYIGFWLENNTIQLTLAAGSFKQATITGSATQEEEKKLEALHAPVRAGIDSLQKLRKATKDTAVKNQLRAQLIAQEEQDIKIDQDWIAAHPASLVSIHTLNIYATTWGRTITQHLFNNMTADMQQTNYGADISDYLALNRNIEQGGQYADFEQLNTGDKPVKLSQIKGKYVLLDFWASWCGPCREENPRLVKTYEAYKSKGFAVLGVSLDDNKNAWLQAVKADNLSWENVCDLRGSKNRAALMYGINSVPSNYLIDEHGVIVAKNLRGKALDNKLKELLP